MGNSAIRGLAEKSIMGQRLDQAVGRGSEMVSADGDRFFFPIADCV